MYDTAAARVWGDPESLATTLFLLGADRHPEPGDDGALACLHWLPETWQREVYDDCGVELPDGNLNRLMAACLHIREPDHFYQKAPRFDFLCRMFHSAPGFRAQYEGHADACDAAWGALEAVILHPPLHPWSAEVKHYVRSACLDAGLETAPPVLNGLGLRLNLPAGEPLDQTDPDHAPHFAGRQSAAAEVEDAVRENCARLHGQLTGLSLRHGDPRPLAAKIGKLLARQPLFR